MRRRWSTEDIHSELLAVARDLGRMPSTLDLSVRGRNDLSCQISKRGGFRAWAKLIGFEQQDSESKLGAAGEDNAIDLLRSLGFEVERQTARAPFDLLVNGVRVDVKTGRLFDSYGTSNPGVRAFIFALNKVPATCDLYLLNCVTGDGSVLDRYFIPASEAKVRTISIMASGRGKYERFRGCHEEISKLVIKTF